MSSAVKVLRRSTRLQPLDSDVWKDIVGMGGLFAPMKPTLVSWRSLRDLTCDRKESHFMMEMLESRKVCNDGSIETMNPTSNALKGGFLFSERINSKSRVY